MGRTVYLPTWIVHFYMVSVGKMYRLSYGKPWWERTCSWMNSASCISQMLRPVCHRSTLSIWIWIWITMEAPWWLERSQGEGKRIVGKLRNLKDEIYAAKLIFIEWYTRWWFQIFLYVNPYLGKWSNLTIWYFVDGLKPPTSTSLKLIHMLFSFVSVVPHCKIDSQQKSQRI